jgi:hypothetical protein
MRKFFSGGFKSGLTRREMVMLKQDAAMLVCGGNDFPKAGSVAPLFNFSSSEGANRHLSTSHNQAGRKILINETSEKRVKDLAKKTGFTSFWGNIVT